MVGVALASFTSGVGSGGVSGTLTVVAVDLCRFKLAEREDVEVE
jgi:hypothetical protein